MLCYIFPIINKVIYKIREGLYKTNITTPLCPSSLAITSLSKNSQ